MKKGMTPDEIQHTARAFSRSRVLLTAVELDIFNLLAGKALTSGEAAKKLDGDHRAVAILLDALAAMGLLTKEEGLYGTPPELVEYLTDGPAASILPGLRHSAHLWKTWSQLTGIVLEGGPASRPESGDEERTVDFIGAMHVRALRDAPELVRAVAPGKARRLIDVGGGSGSHTIGFLRSSPSMKATLFDRPEVIPLARERIKEEGLEDRVALAEGDYNVDDLPGGHDLALLSAVIHQNSQAQNIALYRKVLNALVPGGRIVVRDYVMSADRTEPASGALFAVNMLVNTRGGNSYTLEEIRGGLEEAGFTGIRLLRQDEMSSLVEGFKAEKE